MKINIALSASANLLALLNEAHPGKNFSQTNVTVGTPVANPGNGGRNTSIDLTAVQDQGYSGVTTVNYTRLALAPAAAIATAKAVDINITLQDDQAAILTKVAQVLGLVESELDDYTDITSLIGIEFDDNTAWGQLTILELKLLIYLALQQYEEAKEAVEMFLQYNDNTVERGLFYQAINAVLEMKLDEDLELEDYEANFRRMFGNERMDAAIGSVDGSVRFHGLTPTSMKLEGLDRHLRLIDSYKKLHTARANVTAHSQS